MDESKRKYEEKLGYMQMLQNCIVRIQFYLSKNSFETAEIAEIELNNLILLLPKDIRNICLDQIEKEDIEMRKEYNKILILIQEQPYFSSKGKMIKYYELRVPYIISSLRKIKDELEEVGMLYGVDVVRKNSSMVV